jgi:hypothetical protein
MNVIHTCILSHTHTELVCRHTPRSISLLRKKLFPPYDWHLDLKSQGTTQNAAISFSHCLNAKHQRNDVIWLGGREGGDREGEKWNGVEEREKRTRNRKTDVGIIAGRESGSE